MCLGIKTPNNVHLFNAPFRPYPHLKCLKKRDAKSTWLLCLFSFLNPSDPKAIGTIPMDHRPLAAWISNSNRTCSAEKSRCETTCLFAHPQRYFKVFFSFRSCISTSSFFQDLPKDSRGRSCLLRSFRTTTSFPKCACKPSMFACASAARTINF